MAQTMGRAVVHRYERALLFGGAVLIVAVTTAVPLAFLLVELLRAGPSGLAILAAARPWILLSRSLMLAATVTVAALTIGVPLGVVFARARMPLRRVLFALHTVPMFLPPFLSALGWFHVFGRQGLIGSQTTAAAFFSAAGVIGVLTLAFAPIVTALTALGVLSVDPSQEDAARTVARPIRIMARILVPAAWPAILLAALVVFALALSELGVPMFLRVDVYPAAVFARLGGIDYAPAEAAALVLPLVPVALALLLVERRFLAGRAFAVLGLRHSAREPLDVGRWTWPLTIACGFAACASVLPIAALALRALRGDGFRQAWAWLGTSPLNSLIIAGIAAVMTIGIGFVLGHDLARNRSGASLIDSVLMLAFFLPSAVLAIGLIAAWNRPATRTLYDSLAIVILGFVSRYAAVSARTFGTTVMQSAPSYEEAAMLAGAGYARRLWRIVIPMHRRGAVAAVLFTAVFCLRDLETAVSLYPPGGEPLTVRIFTLEANGPEAIVAALAIFHVGLTAVVLFLGGIALRSSRVPS
jgi:iron(III) transport system permease protein